MVEAHTPPAIPPASSDFTMLPHVRLSCLASAFGFATCWGWAVAAPWLITPVRMPYRNAKTCTSPPRLAAVADGPRASISRESNRGGNSQSRQASRHQFRGSVCMCQHSTVILMPNLFMFIFRKLFKALETHISALRSSSMLVSKFTQAVGEMGAIGLQGRSSCSSNEANDLHNVHAMCTCHR